jgi:hypothetical protein
MILVLSEERDQVTNEVLAWIKYLKKVSVVRVNNCDGVTVKSIRILEGLQSFELGVKAATGCDIHLNLKDIKCFWYRRGEFSPDSKLNIVGQSLIDAGLSRYLLKNHKVVFGFCYSSLKHICGISLGNILDNQTNKLVNLVVAQSVGLHIPETRVCNTKIQALEFLKESPSGLITKGCIDADRIKIDLETILHAHTFLMDAELIIELQNHFAPTLFQVNIEKVIEFRVFFICDSIYTSAILSQNSSKTKTDSREYDKNHPTRCIPYRLPIEIEMKIRMFMKSIDMNCGSIDMIYSKGGEYVFLEVNPVGQFDYYGIPCNYFLPKIVAETLVSAAVSQ